MFDHLVVIGSCPACSYVNRFIVSVPDKHLNSKSQLINLMNSRILRCKNCGTRIKDYKEISSTNEVFTFKALPETVYIEGSSKARTFIESYGHSIRIRTDALHSVRFLGSVEIQFLDGRFVLLFTDDKGVIPFFFRNERRETGYRAEYPDEAELEAYEEEVEEPEE